MASDGSPTRPSRSRGKERTSVARRDDAINAGIEVLADRGARGLTHREIARYLGWPLGSTSNYFRRRIDIFNAIAARMMELDLADLAVLDADLDKPGGISVDILVEHMVNLLRHSTTEGQRSRSRARAEILIESSRNEQVQQAVELQIKIADALFKRVFEQLGAADPVASANLFSTMMACAYLGFNVASSPPELSQMEAIVRSWVAISLQPFGPGGRAPKATSTATQTRYVAA